MRPSPRHATLRRFAVANRTSRDRPEAAAELVRLEYERQRLSRAIAAFEERRGEAYEALALVESRIIWVHGILGIKAAEEAPVRPAPLVKASSPAAMRPPQGGAGTTRRFR